MGLSSEIVLALAKKYTDESVEGGGATKGKNCTIFDISPITGGNRVTFAWYLDGSETPETSTMDVMDGADGATGATGNGIASITKTGTSGLVDTYTITYTNGTTTTFTVTNGGITVYESMPDAATLRALPNDTVFATKGFYSPKEGNGGIYSKNASYIYGSYEIPKANPSDQSEPQYFLTCCDEANNHINLCKYGVRACPQQDLGFNEFTDVYEGDTTTMPTASAETVGHVYHFTGTTGGGFTKNKYYKGTSTEDGQGQTSYSWTQYGLYVTPGNTYATDNSDIIDRIYMPKHGTVYTLPEGKYFFERPMDLRSRNLGLEGATAPKAFDANMSSGKDYGNGTILYFPFLTRETNSTKYNTYHQEGFDQLAIYVSSTPIRNLSIFGNPYVYNMVIDRDAAYTTPQGQVVKETIANYDGSPLYCVGIWTGGGVIQNVYVRNFYTGIKVKIGNAMLSNIFAYECHHGLMISNDAKCVGVYGWDVHTLLTITGSIASAVQIRADSCVHLINVRNGSAISIVDADGDWCAEELMVIGNQDDLTKSAEVYNLRVENLHGRFAALNYYDTDYKPNGYDVRTLAASLDGTAGYGMIRVLAKAAFYESYISVNGIKGHVLDTGANWEKWLISNILFTFPSDTDKRIDTIHFSAPFENDQETILKSIQTKSGFSARIDAPDGTFHIYGNEIGEEIQSVKALPTASADHLGRIMLYTGPTDQASYLYNDCIYECRSDGEPTPSYYWGVALMSLELFQGLVSSCNDYASFKALMESL